MISESMFEGWLDKMQHDFGGRVSGLVYCINYGINTLRAHQFDKNTLHNYYYILSGGADLILFQKVRWTLTRIEPDLYRVDEDICLPFGAQVIYCGMSHSDE